LTTRRWIYDFTETVEIDAKELRALLGGKGESLNKMTHAGLAVPPGFTITTECCRRYYELDRLWPDGLDAQLHEHMRRLEAVAGREFGRGDRPLLVAVRSGASISMPGMMDTILNCGLNSESGDPWAQLRSSITAVFDSWLSPRAIAYRRRNDIRDLPGTAVTVQMMLPSEVSGVVFTEDPNSPGSGRMIIEASYGLGESVVSGDVTPDRFFVCREGLGFETEVGHKASAIRPPGVTRRLDPDAVSLNDDQVRELSKLVLKVEEYYGHPVDVEFGLADGKFSVLQSRRIRGLDIAVDVPVARAEEIARLRSLAGGRRCCWVIHNLDQTLKFPTPLTWDIVRDFMRGDGGFGRMYRQLGYRPSPEVCRNGFLELICGRIYADPQRQAGLFWDAMPLSYDLDAIGADVSLLDSAPTKFDPTRADGRFLAKLPGNLLAMFKASRNTKRLADSAAENFETNDLPPFLDYVRTKRLEDPSELSDGELIAELYSRRQRVLGEFAPASLLPGFFGGMAFDSLTAKLTQLMGQVRGAELAAVLLCGLDGDSTFKQDAMLHRIACGQGDMDSFIDEYGHRCVGEMELAEPRWRQDAGYLEQTVERLRCGRGRTPDEIHAEGESRRLAAAASLPAVLAEWGGSCFREEIERDIANAQALLPYRETGKHYLMMGYELIRLVIEELGQRWDIGSNVYFLELSQLDEFASNREAFSDLAAGRRIRREALRRLDVGDVIDSEDIESLGVSVPPVASDILSGRALASGSVEGVARIVHRPDEVGEFNEGDILVCPSTDPGWTPLFLRAGGLVVERGGVLSHGAIVARDFGMPAVVCPDATKLIRDSARIHVDGRTGAVSILDPEDAS